MSKDDMVTVPREPTSEMLDAVDGLEYTFGSGDEDFKGYVNMSMAEEIYALMLAAAPRGACIVPPEGWTCSRDPGHEGPCAASPAERPTA